MHYPIKTPEQLRPILQGFRKTAGLTQASMASHLGITQQSYAQLEANPASASLDRLIKVLRLLDVDLILEHTPAEPVVARISPAATSVAPARRAAASKRAAGAARKTPVKRSATGAAKTKSAVATATSTKRPARAAGKKREDW